jgi:hypothetical protein
MTNDSNYIVVQLPLPNKLKCKGYALAVTANEPDGTYLECKTRVIADDESLMDYDFSNCYIHDYILLFSERPTLTENFEVDDKNGWNVTVGRKIRFAGEAVKK